MVASLDFSRLPPLPEDRAALYIRNVMDQLRALPQVASAGTSTHVPLDGSMWTLDFRLPNARGESRFTWASPGYFETMGKQLLSGRAFNDRDTPSSPHVAVVNQTFVRRFLSGLNPLGQTLRTLAEPNYPATDIKSSGL